MYSFAHFNYNVKDLDKSLSFYQEALGLKELHRHGAEDGRFMIVFLGDGKTSFNLELTWLRDWEGDGYELGDNEIHLALVAEDYDAAYKQHKAMGCICYENPDMGIYFIEDPDGYWLEIIPPKD